MRRTHWRSTCAATPISRAIVRMRFAGTRTRWLDLGGTSATRTQYCPYNSPASGTRAWYSRLTDSGISCPRSRVRASTSAGSPTGAARRRGTSSSTQPSCPASASLLRRRRRTTTSSAFSVSGSAIAPETTKASLSGSSGGPQRRDSRRSRSCSRRDRMPSRSAPAIRPMVGELAGRAHRPPQSGLGRHRGRELLGEVAAGDEAEPVAQDLGVGRRHQHQRARLAEVGTGVHIGIDQHRARDQGAAAVVARRRAGALRQLARAPDAGLDLGDQVPRLDRLGDEVVAAHADGVEALVEVGLAREEHDRQEGMLGTLAQDLRHLDAVDARQVEVEHDQVGAELADRLQRLLAGGADPRSDAAVAQHGFAEQRLAAVVLDHQHAIVEVALLRDQLVHARGDLVGIGGFQHRVGADPQRVEAVGGIDLGAGHEADGASLGLAAHLVYMVEQLVELGRGTDVDQERLRQRLLGRGDRLDQGFAGPHDVAVAPQLRGQPCHLALGRAQVQHRAALEGAIARARRPRATLDLRMQALHQFVQLLALRVGWIEPSLDEGAQVHRQRQCRLRDRGLASSSALAEIRSSFLVVGHRRHGVPGLALQFGPGFNQGAHALLERGQGPRRRANAARRFRCRGRVVRRFLPALAVLRAQGHPLRGTGTPILPQPGLPWRVLRPRNGDRRYDRWFRNAADAAASP